MKKFFDFALGIARTVLGIICLLALVAMIMALFSFRDMMLSATCGLLIVLCLALMLIDTFA